MEADYFKSTRRVARGDEEALETNSQPNYAIPAPHSKNRTVHNKTSTCTRLRAHEVRGPILFHHVRRVR